MSTPAPMSVFERYLTLWVLLCMAAGVLLGHAAPAVVQSVAQLEVAQVNLPVGLLIWVMIIPMLVKVDFGALGEVRQHVRGIGVTLFVNWLVKPFSMALLGWLFVRQLFAPWLPAEQLESYIAGLILLAAAPCTAMVFVWSRLSRGDPLFTLSQVALNDSIMVVAFAPLVGLLLGYLLALPFWLFEAIRSPRASVDHSMLTPVAASMSASICRRIPVDCSESKRATLKLVGAPGKSPRVVNEVLADATESPTEFVATA